HRIYAVAVVLAAASLLAVIARMGLLVGQRVRDVGQLSASEERYRALVGSLPDTVITVYDRRLRLVFADGAGITEQMGAALTPGRYAPDFAPPDQRPIIEMAYREALAGVHTAQELSFPDTTGNTWSLEIGPY